MPLPTAGTSWPPKHMTEIHSAMAQWSAWYAGDPDQLTAAYSRGSGASLVRPAQLAGGARGALARFWWGRPQTDISQRRGQLHVPIAADLAQASADLLYAEPPTFTITDPANDANKATAARLEQYVDDGLATTLSGGAEVGAALGGRFHKIVWDGTLLDRPFLTTVDADAAIPEFRWGRLVAVTFWHLLAADNGIYLRHLERHELGPSPRPGVPGDGLTFHGLYQGTADNLGRPVPLTDHDATKALATQVDADGALRDGRTPGLAVEYIPNLTPQRKWRTHPTGKALGRSDFDGIEPLMDALDEVYNSWMRDIRLAKARIIVPEYMLQSNGPGKGASFDMDAEVFTPMRMAAGEEGDAPITPQQFAIRVAEHQQTAQQLVEDILRSAGYSASTFGEDEDGAAATATETNARKGRSLLTRGRKVRLERPALARLAAKMLAVDVAVFRPAGVTAADVAVDFGDTVQDSPLQLANTAESLSRAKAASTATLVRMVHPDWTPEQVKAEVGLIHGENAMADPTSPGLFG
ncbi:capsid protein [Georgenia faecalis]|uniref:capsid protein n=1 Tax=Georgenia faecalis TaxID=2483799 RepID=UPI000FDADCBC|nr:capsid protein [Georgenia faecalis]